MLIVRGGYQSKWMWVLTGALAGAGLGGALTYRQHPRSGNTEYGARWSLLRKRYRSRQGSRHNASGWSHPFDATDRSNCMDSENQ